MVNEVMVMLTAARKRQGYTQKYISETLNWNARKYGDIERGTRSILDLTYGDILKVANLLKIDPSELIGEATKGDDTYGQNSNDKRI